MTSLYELEEDIADLEKVLQDSLSPLTPNPVFINNLKNKLATSPQVVLEETRLTTAYLLIAFGLFIGVFVFWLVRRIVRASSGKSQAA